MPVQLKCEGCGSAYTVNPYRRDTSRFCSRDCRQHAETRDVTCARCGKTFRRQRSKAGRGKNDFCSTACYDESRLKRANLMCEVCGKAFEVPLRRAGTARFCSVACRKGSDNPSWGRGDSVQVACDHCGKRFSKHRSKHEVHDGTFCSRECFGKSQVVERVQLDCEWCGDEFERRPVRAETARFCSMQCQGSWTCRYAQNRVSRKEATFGLLLVGHGLGPVEQAQLGQWVVDFFFPDEGVAVEFDGTYWHSLPGASERDERKDRSLRELGYEVLRVPESLYDSDPYRAVAAVREVLADAA